MRNHDIAALFEELADLLDIAGEDNFKVTSYRVAARRIEELGTPLEELTPEARLQLPGIGKAISGKIQDFLEQGTTRLLEEMRSQIPHDVRRLLRLPGLGPKTAGKLYRMLGVCSAGDLEQAIREGRLQTLQGVGPKRAEAWLAALTLQREGGERYLLGTALVLFDQIQALVPAAALELAGEARRALPVVRQLEMVTALMLDTVEAFVAPLGSLSRDADGTLRVRLTDDLPDLVVHQAAGGFGTAWVRFSASQAHIAQLEGIAAAHGLDGLPAAATEGDLYAALGLPWIAPELREGQGEVEAAAVGRLPKLLEASDVLSDLHTHSHYSDGRSTLREMVGAAAARGLLVYAITDHSPSLRVAHGLDAARLEAQVQEIEDLRAQFPGLLLLTGMEVDILADGQLDLSQEWLSRLDVIVASPHTHLSRTRTQQTDRLLRAVHHPDVDILGHATGRLLLSRPGMDVDVEAVLRACAETGTAVELNASPERLDLDAAWLRRARDLGCMVAINTDAHGTEDLRSLRFGIAQARRAWLEAEQVINTWPAERLLSFLHTAKPRRG